MDDVLNINHPAPIKGASQTAQVFTRLRADIIAGRLAPGRKLKIEELRNVYASGASPVREALSIMCTDGLVERIDQRGFRVADIGVKAFDELLKTRCWLEERALRESIANGDSAWEEAVVIAHYRLAKTPRADAGDSTHAGDNWEVAHRAFHRSLLSACASEIMVRFCDQLYDQNIRYRNVAGTAAYPKRDVEREHREIFEAVVGRHADRAVESLIDHYRGTGEYLRKALVK